MGPDDELIVAMRHALATDLGDIVDPLRFRLTKLQESLGETKQSIDLLTEVLRLLAKDETIDRAMEDHLRATKQAVIASPLLSIDDQ